MRRMAHLSGWLRSAVFRGWRTLLRSLRRRGLYGRSERNAHETGFLPAGVTLRVRGWTDEERRVLADLPAEWGPTQRAEFLNFARNLEQERWRRLCAGTLHTDMVRSLPPGAVAQFALERTGWQPGYYLLLIHRF
jgi:hypothetical protein